jgi:hypothetical protein
MPFALIGKLVAYTGKAPVGIVLTAAPRRRRLSYGNKSMKEKNLNGACRHLQAVGAGESLAHASSQSP